MTDVLAVKHRSHGLECAKVGRVVYPNVAIPRANGKKALVLCEVGCLAVEHITCELVVPVVV